MNIFYGKNIDGGALKEIPEILWFDIFLLGLFDLGSIKFDIINKESI